MEELMDIVNENDEVIGRDTRTNVHKNYEIHRGVHVVVVNSRGDVALQRRAMTKDYYPGYLDISVGAQVASGESYHTAAVRELTEELGCGDQNISQLADYDAYSPRQREKRRVFVHRCDGPFQPDPTEVAEVFFVPVTEIKTLLEEESFTEGSKKTLCLFAAAAKAGRTISREEASELLDAAGLSE